MRLTRFFMLSLAVAVFVAAGMLYQAVNPNRTAIAHASTEETEPLRYGTPAAAISNGLEPQEFFDRFVELREQKRAQAEALDAGSINLQSTAQATDTPPSVTEVRASNTANWLGYNTVQTMNDGEVIYMAWVDDRDSAGAAAIYFTRSLDGGATWLTDTRVDRKNHDAGTAGFTLDMAADNHGNIVAIWSDTRNGTPEEIFYATSHDRGTTWSDAAAIDLDSELSILGLVDITSDPAGNFYTVWQDLRPGITATNIYSAASFDRGDTWQTEVKINDTSTTSEYSPLIVATRDRDLVVTWHSSRAGGVGDDMIAARSIDGGQTWNTDVTINTNTAGTLVPTNSKLCSDGIGNVYSMYGLTDSGTGTGNVYTTVSHDFGSTWATSHTKITGARYNYALGNGYTALDCSSGGTTGYAAIAFSGSSAVTGDDDVYVSVTTDGGDTWQTAQRVNTGLAPLAGNDPLALTVGIDRFGHVVTVWTDPRSGTYEAYYNYSNDYGADWATTDARLNGGTPGTHDVTLTDETIAFFGNFSFGSNGTSNTNRLAFHTTYHDDRAGGVGLYDGITTFEGSMQVLNRLSGANRIETSIAINKDLFPISGTSTAVVIATSANFADGLAAGPLGAMLNGSVLLNPQDSLDPSVALEITRTLDFKPGSEKNIYVVGGPAAISDAVIAQLQAISSHARVARVSGATRYGTATAVAQEIDSLRGSGPTGVLLATGENFPDALSASGPGSDAAINPGQMPILLVRRTSLPTEASDYLSSVASSVSNLYAIGGTAALNDAVSSAAAALVPGVVLDRLAGADRYETATTVASFFYKDALAPQSLGLASGEKFPDALGGGRASGAKHQPLLLTTQDSLPSTTSTYISTNSGTLDRGDVYGGTAVIAEDIINAINLLL